MRKTVAIILLMLLLTVVLTGCDYSREFTEDGLDYWCWNGCVIVMGFSEGVVQTELVLKGRYEYNPNYYLSDIYESAFEGTEIESLRIEYYKAAENVFAPGETILTFEIIRSRAFAECKKLKNVELPYGMHTIAEQAFFGCVSLQRIELPFCLKQVNAQAFANCENLQEVFIEENLQFIGEGAFNNCADNVTVQLKCPPPQIDGEIFQEVSNFTLRVSAKYFEQYASHSEWGKYVEHMVTFEE